jgi:drug/metabolite transporter (DMT)-like permease
MPLIHWFLIVFLGAVWGCSFYFNAILIRELGPIWVAALRVAIGASGCWVFFVASGRKLPSDLSLYPKLLLLGLLNYAIPFTLFPYAEENLASGIVGVINGMTPMATVVVSQLFPDGERATWNRSAGVVVGFGGAAILAAPSLSTGAVGQIEAIGACLVAILCYGVTLNYARRLAHVDSATIAATSLTGAALVSIPAAYLVHGPPRITQPETWAALAGIGLFSTSFGFLVLYWLLPRVGATNMSLNTFITPISAILLGVIFLAERFELTHILGMSMILGGLVLIDGRLIGFLRRRSG